MKIVEQRTELVEVDDEEIEMVVLHFIKPVEERLVELGFNIRVDEHERAAFYIKHFEKLHIGISIQMNDEDYPYFLYSNLYGRVDTDYEKLIKYQSKYLNEVSKLIKEYLEK